MTASLKEYLDHLSSGSAVPGGGSAAAVAGAMGVALLSMVATISARKAKDDAAAARLLELLPALDQLRAELGRLSQEDIDAYRGVIEARKRRADAAELERAFAHAAEVPLQTARTAERGLELYTEISKHAWEMTRSDLEAGAALLEVGLRVALANVAINLPELAGQTRVRLELAYEELAARRRQ